MEVENCDVKFKVHPFISFSKTVINLTEINLSQVK